MLRPGPGTPAPAVAARLGEFAVFTALLATLDLLAKSGLAKMLPPGESVDLRVVELRVGYNPGVAFSIGDQLPSWLVLGLTGTITAALVGYAWQILPQASRTLAASVTLVSAGAVANLADRIPDGLVTDYLHTGWFPTFNLADCFITLGAAGAVVAVLREPSTSDHDQPKPTS